MKSNLIAGIGALVLTGGIAYAGSGPVHSATMTNYYQAPSNMPGQKAPPPNHNINYRPGTISGTVWWDTSKVQRNVFGLPTTGSQGFVNGCGGLSVSAGMQSQPVGVLRSIVFSKAGTIAKCTFEIGQVPVGVNLTVSDSVQQSTFKTPVASFNFSPSFRIPGGTCNRMVSPPTPTAGIATCGDRAFNVNLEVVAISSVPQPK